MNVSSFVHVDMLIPLFQMRFPCAQPDAQVMAYGFHTALKFEAKRLMFEIVTNYFVFCRSPSTPYSRLPR